MTQMDEHRRTPSSYLDMYGLGRIPFDEDPEGSSFILFNAQRRAFEQVAAHMVNGGGVLTLRGEPGVGKTQILLAAARVAADSGTRIVHALRPHTDRRDGLSLLSATIGDRSLTETAVRSLLLSPRAALLLDDVDLLTPDVHTGLTSILERVQDQIAIVLTATITRHGPAGRPAGNEVMLPRLSPEEVRQYIERRLWVAGGTTRRLITDDALRSIVTNSQGLPGSVNRMMEAALTAGFARGDGLITHQTIASTFGPYEPRRRRERTIDYERLFQILSTFLLVIGIAAFLYSVITAADDTPPAPAAENHTSTPP
jgi:general secretion pathway protein A